MQLQFQSIIDLVLNSLQNEFLIDCPSIIKFIQKEHKIELEVAECEDYSRTYQVTIYKEQEHENIEKITSVTLVVCEKAIYQDRVLVCSFTADGLEHFEIAMRSVLANVRYDKRDVEEVM